MALAPIVAAAAAIHLRRLGAQIAARATWWSLALCSATVSVSDSGSRMTVGLLACSAGALLAAGAHGIESPCPGSPFTPVAFRRLLVVSMIATMGEALWFAFLGVGSLVARILEPWRYTPAGPMVFSLAVATAMAVALFGIYRLMVWGLALHVVTQVALGVCFATLIPDRSLVAFTVGISAAQLALVVPVFVAIWRRRAPSDSSPSVRTARALPVLFLVGTVVLGGLSVLLHRPLLIFSSRLSEATHMVNAIRVAEEAYHAETQSYACPSAGLDLGQLYPAATPGDFETAWGSRTTPLGQAWAVLSVHADSPVRFGYAAIAGRAGERPTAVVTINGVPVAWPVPREDWYIVIGVGDLNGDGVLTRVIATSWDNDIRTDGPQD